MAIRHEIGQRLTATVPRILSTISNERSSLGRLCVFVAVVRRGFRPFIEHLQFFARIPWFGVGHLSLATAAADIENAALVLQPHKDEPDPRQTRLKCLSAWSLPAITYL
jgi:hypothetical protein